jgi:glycogen operon protein
MHVDGFRFDLASIFSRGKDGIPLKHPPLLDEIKNDPVLAQTKLIAEAWDAGGLYQVGSFPGGRRWLEWNDKFRDTIRRHVRGDAGMIADVATRIAGSSDLFKKNSGSPLNSINFITCHDGFTLNDLVSYKQKNNKMNGENNRDGMNENFSANYGVEGPNADINITRLRRKQIKNLASLLLLSQGVPMILAGDEFGRTQQGNNNAYCQDNEVSWLNWNLTTQNSELLRFFKLLIRFRKNHSALLRRTFFEASLPEKPLIRWYDQKLDIPDWSGQRKSLAFHLFPVAGETDIYIITNSEKVKKHFGLAQPSSKKKWYMVLDTALDFPDDINETGQEVYLHNQDGYHVAAQSTVVLLAK